MTSTKTRLPFPVLLFPPERGRYAGEDTLKMLYRSSQAGNYSSDGVNSCQTDRAVFVMLISHSKLASAEGLAPSASHLSV